MSEGFEYDIEDSDKCIPIGSPPSRSLITIKISPRQLNIVPDKYNPDKLKAHVTDNSGTNLSFVPITDRGFYDYATDHVAGAGDIAEINDFIHSQKSLYLRLGLGRPFPTAGRNGYSVRLDERIGNGFVEPVFDKLRQQRCNSLCLLFANVF